LKKEFGMLKKWLFLLLIFLASTSPAFAYPPMGAWCLNPSGSWIPVAMSAIGTIYPGTPPSTGIYGSSNGGNAWYPLQCDANGNLSAGSILGVTIPALSTGYLYYNSGTGLFTWAAGGGGGMTWPTTPGYALWLSGTTWSTPHLTDNSTTVSSSEPFAIVQASNQFVTGTSTNTTTSTYPASSGAVTLTYPNTSEYMVGANSDTTTTHVLHATAVPGVFNSAAILYTELPTGTGANQVVLGGAITAAGPTGGAATVPVITYNAAGQLTTVTTAAITPAAIGAQAALTNPVTGPGSGATVGHVASMNNVSGDVIADSGVVAANLVVASSPGAGVAHFAGSTQTVTSAAVSLTADVSGTLPAANGGTGTTVGVAPVPVPTPSASITLAAPSGIAVCTGTCTVSVPVPAAGYQFCILNDDNVGTAITLSALGSSARYENSARTAYGTAGTGTLVLSAAAGNLVCIVGRDSTHYFTTNYVGVVTVN
jgi:hypothetical protein